jgi:hypothetical protein
MPQSAEVGRIIRFSLRISHRCSKAAPTVDVGEPVRETEFPDGFRPLRARPCQNMEPVIDTFRTYVDREGVR